MSFSKTPSAIVVLTFVPVLFFFACPEEDKGGGGDIVKPATITFWNTSGYKVDIYKNLNPDYFDPTTLICTLNGGEEKKVEQYPSNDQVTGDTFYPRYNMLLANSLQTDTIDIYADAERVLSNITLVIKSGETYTRTIPSPASNELNFINGYIIIDNRENSQVQIILGDKILGKKDDNTIFLNAFRKGYYEIERPFSYLENTITLSQLKAFSNKEIPFPSFAMERGKIYTFIVQNGIVTGPDVDTILR